MHISGILFLRSCSARFLINFVYACMDTIRLELSDFSPSFSFCVLNSVLNFSSASPLCDSN